MGVINLNSDSFSDPRPKIDLTERIAAARDAMTLGAVILDLGAQSAALGAQVKPVRWQIDVLHPIVYCLQSEGIPVSVDTYEPAVASAVLSAGASVINDFSGALQPALIEMVAEAEAYYVLTHNPTGPGRRQTDPFFYDDIVDTVIAFFESSLVELGARGVPPERILLDPGVDVGKTPRQTLELLRGWERIRDQLSCSQLLAISRKDVLGVLTGRVPAERDAATLGLLEWVADQPRTLIRIHNVKAAYDYLRIRGALRGVETIASDRILEDDLRRQATS